MNRLFIVLHHRMILLHTAQRACGCIAQFLRGRKHAAATAIQTCFRRHYLLHFYTFFNVVHNPRFPLYRPSPSPSPHFRKFYERMWDVDTWISSSALLSQLFIAKYLPQQQHYSRSF